MDQIFQEQQAWAVQAFHMMCIVRAAAYVFALLFGYKYITIITMINNRINAHSKKQKSAEQINLKAHTLQQLYTMAQRAYLAHALPENKWNQLIASKGTRKDKITLMTTSIVEHPQASLLNFNELIKYCSDANHNFALEATRALSNVYLEHVLNDKPILKVFMDSVQTAIKEAKKDCVVSEAELIGYYLEHHIKQIYSELIKAIELLLTSNINYVKKTSVGLLASLTRFKELRRMIIAILINKFGDSDMEIVNQVSKSLKNQFYQDLQASETLLEEAETFLFRQNLQEKPQFYVLNFLNNLNTRYLSEKSLTKLFGLFYHFFEKLMDKDLDSGSISSRLFLNAIKGLNKIFSVVKSGSKETRDSVESKIQKIYATVHRTTNTKAKVQLLLFLFQSHSHMHRSLPDRFYRSLYDFLGRDEILHCSLTEVFFDLVLISMKEDSNLNRVIAYIKRLLQLCFTAQSNFVATCLLLISKVFQAKESLGIFLKQRENCMADEEDEKGYEMWKQEPIYAGAQKTCFWELSVFANHYHPTVRKFTEHLLRGEDIPYEGHNPLIELSQTNFIEKLALKKDKKSESWKIKVQRNLKKIRSGKYCSLLDKPLEDFREDEIFIRDYLQKRNIIHNKSHKTQGNDIEQFADQLIQNQMDRLNPHDISLGDEQSQDEDLGQDEFADQFEEGQEEEIEDQDNQYQEDEEDEGDQEDDGEQASKEFEDVFDEVEEEEEHYGKKKRISKPNRKSNGKAKGNGKSKGKSNGKSKGKGTKMRHR